jgi:hypothetical protein
MRVPDVEKAARALLSELTPSPTTVGIGVPSDWTKDSPDHLQVGWDGTRTPPHRLTSQALIRVTAWASSTSQAKDLALDAEARLCAHDGTGVISTIRPATGVLPARDPDTGAELATFTVSMTVRSTPLA